MGWMIERAIPSSLSWGFVAIVIATLAATGALALLAAPRLTQRPRARHAGARRQGRQGHECPARARSPGVGGHLVRRSLPERTAERGAHGEAETVRQGGDEQGERE